LAFEDLLGVEDFAGVFEGIMSAESQGEWLKRVDGVLTTAGAGAEGERMAELARLAELTEEEVTRGLLGAAMTRQLCWRRTRR
jgi:hypothetical protein